MKVLHTVCGGFRTLRTTTATESGRKVTRNLIGMEHKQDKARAMDDLLKDLRPPGPLTTRATATLIILLTRNTHFSSCRLSL